MPRPISATIDIEAMRHNLEIMRKAAQGRMLWAVVKANAYGHGLENAIEAFGNADGLALLDIADAIKARDCGWDKRILLLEGFFDSSDIRVLERYAIETVVHSDWMVQALEKERAHHIKVHIKVNSGMNRLGYTADAVAQVRERLKRLSGIEIAGIVTHFANAESNCSRGGSISVSTQLSRMKGLEKGGCSLCMANSAALLFHEEVQGDGVRAGIALYGASPDMRVSNDTLGIVPAMTLSSRIIALQQIAPAEAVGYGSRWIASRPSRIAVVACGYADGYPRSMPDGAPVYAKGHRIPLAGAVSMDMLTIDVTDYPDVAVGDEVELWGKHILVNDLAPLCGTIGYELLCSIAPRVPIQTIRQTS